MKLVELIKEHWLTVVDIYREGIETRNATFRTEVPDWKTWNSLCHKYSRFVAINEAKEIVGWCALAPVSKRIEYRGIAEVSVYIRLSATGKNIGSLLMENLISSSEENNIWSLYSSMFPENIGSVKLH